MIPDSPLHADDAPHVPVDADSDEAAWRRFVRALAIGVVLGIPAVTGLMFAAIRAVSDATTEEALIIAAWTALWGGVFAGGATATMIFTTRQEHS